MLNSSLWNNFFEKRSIFRENREKLFSGHISPIFFKERRRLVPKISVTFFLSQITYRTFYYSEEKVKNRFWGPNIFWREEGVWRLKMNNINFFKGNEVLNIFSFNNFFQETNIFRENDEKQFLGDETIF